jgi:hypothetical protein
MLAYAEEIAGKGVSFIGQPESLPGRQICEDCQVLGFSTDSRQALIRYGVNHLVRQDLSTGARTPLLTVDAGEVLDARLSPDDRWVVVVVAAPERPIEAYLAPVGESPALPGTWLRVPTGRSFVGTWVQRGGRRTVRPPSPVWSADGGELYYFSDRDGHTCIWAQRLDPRTKQPRGAPYPLYHLHRPETSPALFGGWMFLAASRDKLIVPEWTVKGNLWTAKLEAPR